MVAESTCTAITAASSQMEKTWFRTHDISRKENKIERGLSARALRLKSRIQALSSRWEFQLNLSECQCTVLYKDSSSVLMDDKNSLHCIFT